MADSMPAPTPGQKKPRAAKPGRAVTARVIRGQGRTPEERFTATFFVGRSPDCDVQVLDPSVSERHAQVLFDGILWWVRDLNTPGGTRVDGVRIQTVPLSDGVEIELGKGGPVVSLSVAAREFTRDSFPAATEPENLPEPSAAPERSPTPAPTPTPSFNSEAEILQRYLRPQGNKPAGRETMMFRRAFEQVEKRSARRYQVLVVVILLVLAGAGSIIAYQARKLRAMRATAEQIFYTAKAVGLEAARTEELILKEGDPRRVAELVERRAKFMQMEQQYDSFVQELGLYSKMSEDERVIFHVARVFGECEVNVPKDFVAEVKRYIGRWRSSERLSKALLRIKQLGYARAIALEFTTRGLPAQYLYLGLQESDFNERAVGPPTRFGHAKGMWQFISLTANRYKLNVGPLFDQPVYDPLDERFNWAKAAAAAASYLKDLNDTDAQGSGMLAMACYNWGEDHVREVIRKLPEDPRERNFWQMLSHKAVPQETYDYVLSIFSAAVICENPKLFGFDVECPRLTDGAPAHETKGLVTGGPAGGKKR
jgi:pSer/pThr/pTyr-binding forkhead associated (FHA) protein